MEDIIRDILISVVISIIVVTISLSKANYKIYISFKPLKINIKKKWLSNPTY
ncbi:hypothetical protein ACAG39_01740 [Caldicellulosiruptoraceae bacterium PP1]